MVRSLQGEGGITKKSIHDRKTYTLSRLLHNLCSEQNETKMVNSKQNMYMYIYCMTHNTNPDSHYYSTPQHTHHTHTLYAYLPRARATRLGSLSAPRIKVSRPIIPNWSCTIPGGMDTVATRRGNIMGYMYTYMYVRT